MGSEIFKSIVAPQLYSERSVNPHNRLYANYPEPADTQLRQFFHSMKHHWCEYVYFGYCGLQGAAIGVIVGIGLINPLIRHSPFVYRKLMMSLKPSESLMPLGTAIRLFWAFVPRYAFTGFTVGVLMKFFSDLYDHTLSTNRLTKYLILGTAEGAFFGFWYGGFRYHWHGAGVGLLLGLVASAGIPTGIMKMRGEFPPYAAEYMPHVSAESKRLYNLQEERLMGFSRPSA